MRDTIKSVLKESFEAHTRTPREQWVVQWPGQVVLAGTTVVRVLSFAHGAGCWSFTVLLLMSLYHSLCCALYCFFAAARS